MLLNHVTPRLPLLAASLAVLILAPGHWALPDKRAATSEAPAPLPPSYALVELPPSTAAKAASLNHFDTTAGLVAAGVAAATRVVAHSNASVAGIGEAAVSNVELAVSMLDGTVIEPGGRLSFDDTARTWDFQEDPRYVMGTATSTRGLIAMRGGGVCFLSTALWRATLSAGLRTDFRQSHYGLVDPLGPGLDATNTLVIRNDSPVPITVRAWIDEEEVHVKLLADESLDRTASVDGPHQLGRGHYVVYQETTWADGSAASSEFHSYYLW
jgi:vancomycin resistance protein YoaR